MSKKVAVIGAGLAGSEAALVLAEKGIDVTLFEMRPKVTSPAHKTEKAAELVCSNSLKSIELPTAHGLLKEELRRLGSPLLKSAEKNRVPAGSALAVDRDLFSEDIESQINSNPNITYIKEEVSSFPEGFDYCIIAAGPLASEGLTSWLLKEFTSDSLHFYDAIAPIITADSVDLTKAFYASRWDKGDGDDYLNCPFTEEEFQTFYDALMEADKVKARDFEKSEFFEACLPIEVVASRGFQALTFGTMRPVGIYHPKTGKRPYAVLQLRKETADGHSLNMVGFQTRMTISEQKKVFRLIPGLDNAEFLRYGTIHRNTYLESPSLLNEDLSFKKQENLFLAGQLCGNEGYTESIATGHYSALAVFAKINLKELKRPPKECTLGALIKHVTIPTDVKFSPSNINYGLLPPLEEIVKGKGKKTLRKEKLCERALAAFDKWMVEI